MIEEFLMPLDRHFDAGFGATADSFHDAAKALDTKAHERGFGLNSSRLPVFYLYRHANELYLKSLLTMLHRRFCSNFPRVARDDFPMVVVNGKIIRIFKVHSILHLYEAFVAMLSRTADQIKKLGRTDWTNVPEGVEQKVKLINDADETSTMFRYPMTLDPLNDAKKSSFKRIHPTKAVAEAKSRSDKKLPGVTILALKDDDGEIVETFIQDEHPMSELFDALKQLAELLSGAQFGMGYEFLKN